jgi:trehalose 6-phosphate phosphatase
VFEVRPNLEWNKGKALEYLMEVLGIATAADVLPLYLGDDRTDEDAFHSLRCVSAPLLSSRRCAEG